MLTGPNVILALKIAVGLVSVLLLASVVCLFLGRYRLHGRINLVFFVLTFAALVAFELVVRVINPEIFTYIHNNPELLRTLRIHLCFAVPSALLMPVMLYTGLTRRRRLHFTLAIVFGILWTATFVTGIFFLPHVPENPT